MAEGRDAPPHLARRPVVDPVLELLDLPVHRVQRGHVAVGDVVDEPVDEDAGRRSFVACRPKAREIERIAAAGGALAHGDDEGRGRDEPDLDVVEAVLVRQRARGHEQPEDVRAVALDHRTDGGIHPRARREHFDHLGVDLCRKRSEQLLGCRVDEVDPPRVHSRRQ